MGGLRAGEVCQNNQINDCPNRIISIVFDIFLICGPLPPMGGWVDGPFFDIYLKPPQQCYLGSGWVGQWVG